MYLTSCFSHDVEYVASIFSSSVIVGIVLVGTVSSKACSTIVFLVISHDIGVGFRNTISLVTILGRVMANMYTVVVSTGIVVGGTEMLMTMVSGWLFPNRLVGGVQLRNVDTFIVILHSLAQHGGWHGGRYHLDFAFKVSGCRDLGCRTLGLTVNLERVLYHFRTYVGRRVATLRYLSASVESTLACDPDIDHCQRNVVKTIGGVLHRLVLL